ncbi:hypothetical protein IP84_07620 [beta proteobacterium AAP99]|nr:hypothetical protein IP84_07620 [beta proteobacterium AAP99]
MEAMFADTESPELKDDRCVLAVSTEYSVHLGFQRRRVLEAWSHAEIDRSDCSTERRENCILKVRLPLR